MKLLKPIFIAVLFAVAFQQPVFAATVPTYKVIKVVDGDTIDVQVGKKVERIRMIGMDTPETVDPRKAVQCFGKEASNKTKALLLGKSVGLQNDPTQGERDKYGRLLRYVILNGQNFNKLMIGEGYAHEYTYDIPYKYQTVFKQAQQNSKKAQKGLWNPSTCNGSTTKAATTTLVTSTTAPAVKKSVTTYVMQRVQNTTTRQRRLLLMLTYKPV